jgi:hypothetical protein
VNISNQHLKNQSIYIGSESDGFVSDIRGDSIFENCEINIVQPKYYSIFHSKFVGCTILAKVKIQNFANHNSLFHGCKFLGEYFDSDFGKNLVSNVRSGGLVSCDFSEADLHYCRLYFSDPYTMKYPRWPYITILYPRFDLDHWMSTPLKSTSYSFKKMCADSAAPNDSISSLTFHWPRFAKSKNDDTDPDVVREYLTGKDYIYI